MRKRLPGRADPPIPEIIIALKFPGTFIFLASSNPTRNWSGLSIIIWRKLDLSNELFIFYFPTLFVLIYQFFTLLNRKNPISTLFTSIPLTALFTTYKYDGV